MDDEHIILVPSKSSMSNIRAYPQACNIFWHYNVDLILDNSYELVTISCSWWEK